MSETDAGAPIWPDWQRRCLIALGLALAAYLSARGFASLLRASGLLHDFLSPLYPRYAFLLNGIHTFAIVAIGLFALLRGRSDPRAVLLALALFAFANILAFHLPAVEPVLGFPIALCTGTVWALCWPLLCMHVSGGGGSPRQRRWVTAIALVCGAATFLQLLSQYLGILPGSGSNAAGATVLLAVVGAGFAILLWNYRGNDAVGRNRIKILLLAFTIFPLTWLLSIAAQEDVAANNQWGVVATTGVTAGGLAGASLIAYAVLRRQLFDINFALNRTLVYGAVSFILLAGFGLAEWAVEHLIPETWHESGPFFSAGIALALFLSFHRLRDWVEHHIERFFFHSWQQSEAALRRFVASAAHFRQAQALCHEFAAEAGRFTHGAGTALYLREETGDYSRRAGRLADAPDSWTEEDRVLALMLAERAPIDMVRAHSALPGALALPMLDQIGLFGFMLLGARPDGAQYRPDEIGNLGWAAQQIGLDLQAIEARALRAEVAALRGQLARRGERKQRPPAPRLASVSGGMPT